jgi:hypothetical protein
VKEHRQRVFVDTVLKSIVGPKTEEAAEAGEHCVGLMMGFMVSTLQQILSGRSNQEERDGWSM